MFSSCLLAGFLEISAAAGFAKCLQRSAPVLKDLQNPFQGSYSLGGADQTSCCAADSSGYLDDTAEPYVIFPRKAGMNAVGVVVKDLALSKKFYIDVLGGVLTNSTPHVLEGAQLQQLEYGFEQAGQVPGASTLPDHVNSHRQEIVSIAVGNLIVELIHITDKITGNTFIQDEAYGSGPATLGSAHFALQINPDIDTKVMVADMLANCVAHGIPCSVNKWHSPDMNEESAYAFPLTYPEKQTYTPWWGDGWSLIYFIGPSGEVIELNQVPLNSTNWMLSKAQHEAFHATWATEAAIFRRGISPLEVMRWSFQHIGITVDNWEQSFKFYQDILGGKLIGDAEGITGAVWQDILLRTDTDAGKQLGVEIPDMMNATGNAHCLRVAFFSFGNSNIEILNYYECATKKTFPGAFGLKNGRGTAGYIHVALKIDGNIDAKALTDSWVQQANALNMSSVRCSDWASMGNDWREKVAFVRGPSWEIIELNQMTFDAPAQQLWAAKNAEVSSNFYPAAYGYTAIYNIDDATCPVVTLTQLAMVPYTGNAWPFGLPTLIAARLFFEKINAANFVPKVQFEAEASNDGCNPGFAARNFGGMITNPNKKFFSMGGFFCFTVAERMANQAPAMYLPHVSWGTAGPDVSKRSQYPGFFRTRVADSMISYAWVKFCESLGWMYLGILRGVAEVGSYHYWKQQINDLDAFLASDATQVVKGWEDYVTNDGLGSDVLLEKRYQEADIASRSLKASRVRAIAVLAIPEKATSFACFCYRLGMRGLVYMSVGWFWPNWYVANAPGNWYPVPSLENPSEMLCTNEEFFHINNYWYFKFNAKMWADGDDVTKPLACTPDISSQDWYALLKQTLNTGQNISTEYLTMSEWNRDPSTFSTQTAWVDEVSTTYDALCLLVLALKQILANDEFSRSQIGDRGKTVYTRINEVMQTVNFQGSQGFVTYPPDPTRDFSSDPLSGLIISQLQGDTWPHDGGLTPVAKLQVELRAGLEKRRLHTGCTAEIKFL
jgi:catechol 2,3-dioxygenase-like lactoylglutathione lyase family enzyme